MYSKLPRCILFGCTSRVRRNKTFRLLSAAVIKRPRIFLVIRRPNKRPAKLFHLSANSISMDIYIISFPDRFQIAKSWKNCDHPRVKPRDNNNGFKKYGLALDRYIISNRNDVNVSLLKIRTKGRFEIGVTISEQSVKYPSIISSRLSRLAKLLLLLLLSLLDEWFSFLVGVDFA